MTSGGPHRHVDALKKGRLQLRILTLAFYESSEGEDRCCTCCRCKMICFWKDTDQKNDNLDGEHICDAEVSDWNETDVSAAAGHTRHTHVKLDLSSTKINTTAQRKTIRIQSLKTQTSQNQRGENLQTVPGGCWSRPSLVFCSWPYLKGADSY